MTDIATRLRQTRADMIGTDDEQHYWDCHDAANVIESLRTEIRTQRQEIAALRAAQAAIQAAERPFQNKNPEGGWLP